MGFHNWLIIESLEFHVSQIYWRKPKRVPHLRGEFCGGQGTKHAAKSGIATHYSSLMQNFTGTVNHITKDKTTKISGRSILGW